MVNFETCRAVYFLKNGMNENGEKSDDITQDDLDEMNRQLNERGLNGS